VAIVSVVYECSIVDMNIKPVRYTATIVYVLLNSDAECLPYLLGKASAGVVSYECADRLLNGSDDDAS